jgi:hypothetical protein
MKKWLLLVLLASSLTSCISLRLGNRMGLESTELGSQTQYERTVKAVVELLIAEAPFPSNYPEKPDSGQKPGDFDPNRLFTILKHISMEPGFSLDYNYLIDRDSDGYAMGGEPSLYASPTGEQPVKDSSHGMKNSVVRSTVFEHIIADGSPDSFFELAILRIIGSEFYIFWHRLPGKDIVPVAGSETLRNYLTPLGILWIRLFQRDVEPTVILEETTATVSFLTFSDWKGVYRRTLIFQRVFPHTLINEKARCLLPHDRYFGVQF